MLPLLMILILKGPGEPADARADFSRFTKAINQEIAIVDIDGTVREGILTEAADDQVSVRFGSGTRTFSRANIASAERTRDGRIDGAVKGVIFGSVMGVLSSAYSSHSAGMWLTWLSVYGSVGYLLDAAQTNREPIYRSPAAPAAGTAAPKPSMSLSFRF